MAPKIAVQPSLERVHEILTHASSTCGARQPTLVPVCASLSAEFLTPSSIYLRLAAGARSGLSFLFESAATTETIGRFSFVGIDPKKTLKTGPGHGPAEDPMPLLQQELEKSTVALVPELKLPPLVGGAIGYVGYDCVRYFEPRTARADMADVLGVPESMFMFFDTVVAFDHFFQSVQIMTYMHVPSTSSSSTTTDAAALDKAYKTAEFSIRKIVALLQKHDDVPLPPQGPIQRGQTYTSNVGRAGYEQHVRTLKGHIRRGDIFQTVPSQRVARPTSLHPFNVYRRLRAVNPSPYLFYVSCGDFSLVGASPELLVKHDAESGRVVTHPIAGTVPRGASPEQDEALASTLRASLKDRAEHVMLVDLARNDVNRVCTPSSTRVDKLMVVQRFSHVQHLVSEVSGVLRPGKTRFDAFRSIFPAGTVSGAPKVRAMQLIAELEREKRGVYAGAVGYFGYDGVDVRDGARRDGAMDTCIALRTMVLKEGVAYLQAGGGIVHDSDPGEEYEETMSKLRANMRTIETAEDIFAERDGAAAAVVDGAENGAAAVPGVKTRVHVDLAGG